MIPNHKFVLYRDKAGEWRFTFVAINGEPIAVSSEGYKNEADARRGIALLQANCTAPGVCAVVEELPVKPVRKPAKRKRK